MFLNYQLTRLPRLSWVCPSANFRFSSSRLHFHLACTQPQPWMHLRRKAAKLGLVVFVALAEPQHPCLLSLNNIRYFSSERERKPFILKDYSCDKSCIMYKIYKNVYLNDKFKYNIAEILKDLYDNNEFVIFKLYYIRKPGGGILLWIRIYSSNI